MRWLGFSIYIRMSIEVVRATAARGQNNYACIIKVRSTPYIERAWRHALSGGADLQFMLEAKRRVRQYSILACIIMGQYRGPWAVGHGPWLVALEGGAAWKVWAGFL